MLRRILAAMAVVPFLLFSAPLKAEEATKLPIGLQLYMQAQKKVSVQEYDDAILLFLQSVDASETNELKRLAATGVLNSHLAAGFYFQEAPDKVVYHLTEALKLKPTVSRAWSRKGQAHCKLKQYQDCDDALTMAIEHSPIEYRHHLIWQRAVTRHVDMNRPQLAAKDFVAATKQAQAYGDTKMVTAFLTSAKAFGYNITRP
ncbi:hypothetical protein C1752_10585 [Acaryochloris thomasi RCC1774]|uniref:Tetratricopeptide repeat protein n=2 Tax=Acaryochloris TaxID=155977 RepID=A0A2W1J8X9_9CYAN|nr:hypothetical protein C1752_10585 [Acaryochloris thomasi RCC1774]